MTKKRVAVLRGGPSSEYEVSMNTGSGVLTALRQLGYEAIDIPVTKTGEWIINGRVKTPDKALATADVVFIAMHGEYGEDGTVQRLCERFHIPFTGSNSFASSVAFNKDATKRALRDLDILLPKHIRVTNERLDTIDEVATAIIASYGPEYVIKPTTSGSSHGVVMATSDNLASLLRDTLKLYDECLVEERIFGTEATCAVLEQFRDTDLYVLPPIEIIPPKEHGFFAADVKYNGATTELCPGRFTYETKQRISELASLVHTTLGLTHYSRTDCIVKNGNVYFLEVNTLPGLTSESLFPKAAAAVGLSFTQLIDHLVTTARVY